MTYSRITQTAVLASLGLVSGYGMLSNSFAMAQQETDGASGPVLTVSLSQNLSFDSNAGLASSGGDSTVQANTGLSFALTDETALSTFALTGSTGLRLADGPATSGFEAALADPRIALAYARIGATSRLDLNAGLRINDIAYLRPLTDFLDENGVPQLPSDFADLRGSGIRQNLNFDVSLSLRDDAPFGIVLAAGISDLRYTDVTDPDLTDNQRSYVRATARLDINEVTQATVGLAYATYTDNDKSNDTLGLTGALSITRPDGELRFNLGLDDLAGDLRSSFSVGRSFDRPNGSLSFDLGTSIDADGNLDLTGNIALSQEFAQGSASASLSQSVVPGSGDAQELQTALSLGFTRELSDLASLSLGLAYAVSEDTDTGLTVDTASVTASLGYALSADWNLNVGASYESRDEDGAGSAQNTSVFVGLSRDFAFPL